VRVKTHDRFGEIKRTASHNQATWSLGNMRPVSGIMQTRDKETHKAGSLTII